MLHYNTAHRPVSFSPLDVVIEKDVFGGLFSMVPEFLKTNSYIPVNIHIIYFLIFLNIQKSSGNLLSCTELYCKQTTGPILGSRQNERLKILFCFSWKSTPNQINAQYLIIEMIP